MTVPGTLQAFTIFNDVVGRLSVFLFGTLQKSWLSKILGGRLFDLVFYAPLDMRRSQALKIRRITSLILGISIDPYSYADL